jgi:hypothetical protein
MILMLFVEDIIKIVKLGIASSYLKGERNYLNIMLLADPEAGKTSMLLCFNFDKLKNVFTMTDPTKSTLQKFIKELTGNPHILKYIIIPDFTRIKSHGKSTEKGIIGLLNSGIEEGLREITTHITGGLSDVKVFDEPRFFGMATSMTRQFMGDRRVTKQWYSLGFLSRFIPVSYSYTDEQKAKVREYLAEGRDLFNEVEILRLSEKRVGCKSVYVSKLNPYIDKLIEASHLYGFRYTKQFRIMLKANALLRGETDVDDVDVEEVKRLMRYINLDYSTLVSL